MSSTRNYRTKWGGLVVAAALTAGALLPGTAAQAQETVKPAGQPPAAGNTKGDKVEQEILALSKEKWSWMSERKVDALAGLFHEKAVFVHMGGSMSRKQELDVIKGGGIQYKTIDIKDSSVRFIENTAIVLSTIRLVAVVGGNEVTNPFVVTEVYVQQGGAWKLAQLSFTRTLGQ